MPWFLNPIKYSLNINPISEKLGSHCATVSLCTVESTLSLTNDKPSNKRKVSTAYDFMCKDYVDVMENIDFNDPKIIQVAKYKFNEMHTEIIKLQVSKITITACVTAICTA